METMDVDKALYEVGGHRPYHWLLFSLLNMCVFVPTAANGMMYVFIGWTPGHHCHKYHSNNKSESSLPFNASLPQCLESTLEPNVTVPCQNGWVYDAHPATEWSIVTEWDLVCNYDYLAELGETFSTVAAILGFLLITPMSDKYGRKPVFLIGMILYIISGTALAFSPSISVYFALRFFVSFFSIYGSVGTVMVIELYSTRHRAFAGMGLEFFWEISILYMAMLMYFFRIWRNFLLVLTIPWLAFLGFYWLLPESAPWLLSVGRKDDAVEVLKTLARRNRVKWSPKGDVDEEISENQKPDPDLKDDEEKKKQIEEDIPFMKQLILLVKDPILRKHTFMNCLYWFTDDNVYLGIILISPALVGDKYLSFTLGALAEIPAYVIAYLVVPYGRRIPTVVFHLITAVSLFVAALVIGLDLGGDRHETVLLIVTLFGKFGITGCFAVMILYTMELFPTNLRGAGGNYGKICGRIGLLGSLYLAYWMKYNAWLPLVVMGSLALVTSLASFILPETCDKKMPQSLQDVYDLYKRENIKAPPSVEIMTIF